MENMTEQIKKGIKSHYQSLRRFADESDIPYSTLTNCLSKGISGTAYSTVAKICNMLDIKQDSDTDLEAFDGKYSELYRKLTTLDRMGIHTIETILDVETARCEKEKAQVRHFNGLGYGEGSRPNPDDDRIRKLVRIVLDDKVNAGGEEEE
ncbi:MAG: hypothetical protein IJT77_06480 [Clostridia bacterium]|nr:hypothetical protein [Clostridia bacterium]